MFFFDIGWNKKADPTTRNKISRYESDPSGEQNPGRRALREAFEENARQKVSGFQTG